MANPLLIGGCSGLSGRTFAGMFQQIGKNAGEIALQFRDRVLPGG